MQSWSGTRAWIEANRDLCVEAIRIYLGLGLMLKGLDFLHNEAIKAEFAKLSDMPLNLFGAHAIGLVHIFAGLMLALGLLTRVAAIIQVPVLFCAVVFVHGSQGLFTENQSLEFTLLVLFLLVVFSIYGSGRLSVDSLLAKNKN